MAFAKAGLPNSLKILHAGQETIAKTKQLGMQDYLLKQAAPPETAKHVESLKARWLNHA